MSRKILVDEKSIELAYHFLSEFALATQYDVRELSERIQETVEEFITAEFNVPKSPTQSELDNEERERIAAEADNFGLSETAQAWRDSRDPDPTKTGMFVLHNCWRCQNGAARCVFGNPRQCEYLHARND